MSNLISIKASALLGTIGVAFRQGHVVQIVLDDTAPLALAALGQGQRVAETALFVREVFAAVEAP